MARDDRELQELLPFFQNGSLHADERTEIEAYLERSESARAELMFLGHMQEVVRDEHVDTAPTELERKRILRRIRVDGTSQSSSTWIRYALAASIVVIAIQGAWWLGDPPNDRYQPAGATNGQIVIEFAPDAREEQIREMLLDAGVQIVQGPGATGSYELRLITPDPDLDTVRAVVARLRARVDVVEHASRR